MTLIIKDTSSTTAGVNTQISTTGDRLYVLDGVLLASTGGYGISISSSADDVTTRIDGTVVANGVAIITNGARTILNIGETGVVTSFNASSAAGGVDLPWP